MPLEQDFLTRIEKIVADLLQAYDQAPNPRTFAPFIPVLRLWWVSLQSVKDDTEHGDPLS